MNTAIASIAAGRVGLATAIVVPNTVDAEQHIVTVVALEDEIEGQVKVRVCGAEPGIIDVEVDSIDWYDMSCLKLPPNWSQLREAVLPPRKWWLNPIDVRGPFLPFEFVFKVATMAERDGIALDVAYISHSGEPVDVETIEVLDMGYASGALLAQAVDTKRPIQVMRALDALLEMAPAIVPDAYEREMTPQRVLISIPLDQVLSIRLRTPTLDELISCHCAYALDAPSGIRKCAYCRQLEASADLVAGES